MEFHKAQAELCYDTNVFFRCEKDECNNLCVSKHGKDSYGDCIPFLCRCYFQCPYLNDGKRDIQ